MNIRTLSETELVDHLLQHAQWLRRHLESRIPHGAKASVSAEDLLQEVWISALRVPRDSLPENTDDLRRWLGAIARNRLVDSLRQLNSLKRGRYGVHARGKHGLESSLLDPPNTASSPSRTPSSEMCTEVAQAVREALASLPDNSRRASELYYIEERSREEIAEHMDKSVSAIARILAEAREQLRRRLGPANEFFSTPGLEPDDSQDGEKESENDGTPDQEDASTPSFDFWIDPGEADVDDLRAFLMAISDLHRAAGGLGLTFEDKGLEAYAFKDA